MTTLSSWFDHSIKENKLVASQPMVIDNSRVSDYEVMLLLLLLLLLMMMFLLIFVYCCGTS